AGFGNAVAPLGTALTPSQARLLRKYSDRVTIAFDGDPAGSAAARRAIPHLVQEGMMVMVARLPEGEDPASLVTGGKADLLRSLLDSGEDWLVFLRGLYPDSLEGKKGFEAEIMAILKPLQPEEREAYLSRAKEILGYSQDWVVGINRRLSEGKPSAETARKPEKAHADKEIILISHAISHKETEPFAQGLSLIDPADLSNPVARKLLELHREGRSFSDLLREEGLGDRISAALTQNSATDEDIKMSFVIMVMEARYRGLGPIIARAEASGDRSAANAALAQKPFLLRMVDILRKIKERKALRYPERRNLILEKLWSAWEAVNRGEDGKLAESELDRLDRLLSRINEPVWDEDQTQEKKGAKTHGRDKR
ncbi:MAG: toprim domain-containing protein, partial [candidate division WOR-3 bacterium]